MYISLKSHLVRIANKKLLNIRREGVFVSYSNEMTKQFFIYAPNLRYAIRVTILNVNESKQGGSLDLKIRCGDTQGTFANHFTS